MVTATAVLILVERGLLQLDEPIHRWLPGLRLPGNDRSLSVRHLLTHTAGWQGAAFVELAKGNDARDGLTLCFEAIPGLPQLASPGTLWAYNNWGFIILG